MVIADPSHSRARLHARIAELCKPVKVEVDTQSERGFKRSLRAKPMLLRKRTQLIDAKNTQDHIVRSRLARVVLRQSRNFFPSRGQSCGGMYSIQARSSERRPRAGCRTPLCAHQGPRARRAQDCRHTRRRCRAKSCKAHSKALGSMLRSAQSWDGAELAVSSQVWLWRHAHEPWTKGPCLRTRRW